MSDDLKATKLPSANEIMNRLTKVEMGANEYMAERFFPLIQEEAGRELNGPGVVMMLTLKIYDFMKQGGYPPFMETALHMYVPHIIDALVDDKEVAEAAKRFHAEVMKGEDS